MADKLTNITTSSNTLDGIDVSINTAVDAVKNKMSTDSTANKMQILTNLAENLSESYQLVKLRQQQYMELAMSTNTTNNRSNSTSNINDDVSSTAEVASDSWQIVNSAKNKLKRKKTMSASLTSVTDTVNQEKRTRIEGIHLNCRGRLPLGLASKNPKNFPYCANKPPIPNVAANNGDAEDNQITMAKSQTPQPRLRRKQQDNAMTIQKLTALTEQLRVEINELKSNLHSERGAVRVLRAQNESETRKWKNEIRRLQNTLLLIEKSHINKGSNVACSDALTSSQHSQTTAGAATVLPSVNNNNEIIINKLKNEIQLLKKTNKCIDEKKLINNDADRRKAADIRLLRDSYEIRLTQLQKSAKNEITRLLEEIKTKERSIGQLKNDLKILKNKTQICEIKRKNATKSIISNVKSTTYKQNNTFTNGQNKRNVTNNGVITTVTATATQTDEVLSSSLNLNEMTQLREVSPFDSTSNFQNNTKNGNTLKTLPINTNTKTATALNQTKNNINNNNNNSNNDYTNKNDFSSINEENHINNFTTNEELQADECEECKIKYNNDSDSAVSSAPPSISPQPSSAALQTADIWQTVRNFNSDLEKWQKKNEILEHKNQQLRNELQRAKETILYLEQNTRSSKDPDTGADLSERLKNLEELVNQLQEERNELKEQNELLEFRIIELEETNDKQWSTQNNSVAANDVWYCDGKTSEENLNVPHSSQMLKFSECLPQLDDSFDYENCENLIHRIARMLKNNEYDMEDKHCLQQIIVLLQQTKASEMRKLNSNIEEDFDCNFDIGAVNLTSDIKFNTVNNNYRTTQAARIVATVQPYKSTEQQLHDQKFQNSHQEVPQNSPRKTRHNNLLQANSLSESGVFVDNEFLGDSIDLNSNKCTQPTAIEESVVTTSPQQQQQQISCIEPRGKLSFATEDINQRRLQYYKERLEILESKILIYESSGDIQAKHLADRLQREVQLEKERKELLDRVEYLEFENNKLEEEKCEFEEAENDTRLRLQRLEVDLEILGQRNVELELSREAFCAKYKDCRGECLNLRDDLVATKNQIQYLEAEKQLIKENYEFLQDILPLLLIYYYYYYNNNNNNNNNSMGNVVSEVCNECLTYPYQQETTGNATTSRGIQGRCINETNTNNCNKCNNSGETSSETQALREEVKCLRQQVRQINLRHYEALESADSHWSQMEQQYKTRENVQRGKEASLKQKICQLKECLRDDARAANEKITQLEEQEKELQCCLVRLSKENNDLVEKYKCVKCELDKIKAEQKEVKSQAKPLQEELECERKRIKAISDELSFLRKLHQETDISHQQEVDCLRKQLSCLKKEYLHIEVTNSELREEVSTLEKELCKMQHSQKECCEKIRCLSDEVRNKDEMLQKLECVAKKNMPAGNCLAQELKDDCGSPSKRCKLEDATNLKDAAKCLGEVLESTKECTLNPTHKQFQSIAQDVKKLADCLLGEKEVRVTLCPDVPNCLNKQDQLENDNQNADMKRNSARRSSASNSSVVKVEVKEEEEDEEKEKVEKEETEEDDVPTVTVGMVIMPSFEINNNICMRRSNKKQITEVPSDMRKLAPQVKNAEPIKKREHMSKMKPSKRSGIYKIRTASLKYRVQRVVSNLTHKISNKFNDASELEMYSSEVLQHNVSFASFHSAKDALEKCDNFFVQSPCTQTQKSDKSTETDVEKIEIAVQVDSNINPDIILMSLPYDIRAFLGTIRSYLPWVKDDEIMTYNKKVLELWEHDMEFQKGLQILHNFTAPDDKRKHEVISLDNYEKYVHALKCLQSMESICKPFSHPILKKIDHLISERLMQFHSRKMQEEFYCDVYYPVEREAPKLFIKKT